MTSRIEQADCLQPTWQTADGAVQLYLGDCLEVLPTLEAGSVDAVVTDPPYELKTASGNKGCFAKSYAKVTSQELQAISDGFEVESAFDEYARILRTISVFVFCSNSQIARIMTTAYRRDWNPTLLVWHKYNSVPFCHGTWRQDAEFCIHIKRAGAPMNGNAEVKSKVKRLPMESSDIDHPTVKPLELLEDYVGIGSHRGDRVIDPFLGSGTTGVACVRLGRKFIGVEKESKYFDIAVKRIEAELNRAPLFEEPPQVQRKLM